MVSRGYRQWQHEGRTSTNPALKVVVEELIDHFRWTSVQGLVELEADAIARFAWHRAQVLESQVLDSENECSRRRDEQPRPLR